MFPKPENLVLLFSESGFLGLGSPFHQKAVKLVEGMILSLG